MSQERILGQILLGTLTKKVRGFLKPRTPQNVTLASIIKKHDQKTRFNWWDAITRWEGPVLATLIIGGLANLTVQVYMAERYDDITRKLYLWNHFYQLYLENLEYCEYLQERKSIWEKRLEIASNEVFEIERVEEIAREKFRRQIGVVQKQCQSARDLMQFKVKFKNNNEYYSDNDVQNYFHSLRNSSNIRFFNFQFFSGRQQKIWCVKALEKFGQLRRNLKFVQQQETFTRLKFEALLQQLAEVHHELLGSLQQQQKYLEVLRFLGNQSARQHQFGVYSIVPLVVQQFFYDFQINYYMGCWFQEEGLDKIEEDFEKLENISLQDLIDTDE